MTFVLPYTSIFILYMCNPMALALDPTCEPQNESKYKKSVTSNAAKSELCKKYNND